MQDKIDALKIKLSDAEADENSHPDEIEAIRTEIDEKEAEKLGITDSISNSSYGKSMLKEKKRHTMSFEEFVNESRKNGYK